MAKRGNLRKNNLSVKLEDGTIMNAKRDNASFRKTFTDWENMAKGLSGDTIGHYRAKDISLYEMFKQQGVAGRVMGNSGPARRNKGGVEIFKMIRKLKSSREYSSQELDWLNKLDKLMDEYAKPESDLNPANIYFENPTDWTEKGTVLSTEPVYGHYRTEDYQDNRADKVNKDYPEGQDVPAVNSDWYNTSKGQAKPPYWQAIYGDGTGDVFTGKSLHQCVKEAIESFNNLEFEVSKKTPIRIEKAGAWKKALQIDEISDIVTKWVNAGPNRNGNFSNKLCVKEIMDTEHSIEGNESEVVKSILEIPGIKQDIKKIWVKISRRQANRMAHEVASKMGIETKGIRGFDVLQFVQKEETPEEEPDNKKAMLKSWKEILII